jgi:hypothetical protein
MIGTEELLCLVTFSDFVHMIQVLGARIPICRVGKLLPTITAHIRRNGVRR